MIGATTYSTPVVKDNGKVKAVNECSNKEGPCVCNNMAVAKRQRHLHFSDGFRPSLV